MKPRTLVRIFFFFVLGLLWLMTRIDEMYRKEAEQERRNAPIGPLWTEETDK
jgi:hypothetical protein